ncbi:MAG: glutamate 5-kinase [Anaeroplasma sp.]|nr:glutamate 5-kinase [Anaeroplasma sp.]
MRDFGKMKRIIIKIGSSSITTSDLSINKNLIDFLMKSFLDFKKMGIGVALVSSGAIALGMHELGLKRKPKEMSLKQACASVGQAKLMEYYNFFAEKYNLKCGQILVNHDDFEDRKRMLYLSNTLDAMFKNDIIPILNENDALAVEEIKVGDNDTLAALVAPMIDADLLILFSDIDGLYDKNPKIYNDAKMIEEVSSINDDIKKMCGANTSIVGTGGMITKINAAKIVTTAGCNMIICNSNMIERLIDIINGENIGTLFIKNENSFTSREHWMIYKTHSKGKIIIDDGCKNALLNNKISILPKGIIGVSNVFLKNSIVDIVDKSNNILAKGISNYSSSEISKIQGMESSLVLSIFGPESKKEVIHANNLVILKEEF